MNTYTDIKAVNWSSLKHMRTSAKAYHYWKTHKRPDTASLYLGRVVHVLYHEPETFEDVYDLFSGASRRGKAWTEFVDGTTNEPVLMKEKAHADKIVAALHADPAAERYMAGGYVEQTITWTDEITGLACKGRADNINGRVLDLKTTANIQPRKFAADAIRFGYPSQLAFYHDGLLANGVTDLDDPTLVVVESSPPYDVIVYPMPSEEVEAGRKIYRDCLEKLARCLETDEWPGIAPEPIAFVSPAWAKTETITERPTMGGVPMTF